MMYDEKEACEKFFMNNNGNSSGSDREGQTESDGQL